MRFLLSIAAALQLVCNAHGFLDDENNFVEEAGLVRFPLTGNRRALEKHMRRGLETGLANQKNGMFYTMDIEIGTPPQLVAVNFDTGSSELWVNPNCDKSSDAKFCKSFGAFGVSSSWTNTEDMGNKTLHYGTGFANITYGYDYVTVGSSKIAQQVFGIAHDSEIMMTGILGVGPNLKGWSNSYPYVIDSLVEQKFINSRAFSLDIRSIDSPRGAVIFGGIDTKKMCGPLVKKSIVPAEESPDHRTRFWASCDSIKTDTEDATSKIDITTAPHTFLFDSGYTVSAFPSAAFDQLLKAFPSAQKDGNNTGQYTVDCDVTKVKGTIDFKFGAATVSVSFADFIWPQPERKKCVLGAVKSDNLPVLGDTFLRSAYVVYDWDNRNLHIAAAADCGSNLVPIGSGPDAVGVTEGDCCKKNNTSSTNSTSSSSVSAMPTGQRLYYSNSTGFAGKTGLLPSANSSSTTAPTTYTSTVKITKVQTITSCAPTYTECSVGKVVTETIISYTTWCPEESKNPKPTTTNVMTTSAYTKPPYTESTRTFTITKTLYCTQGQSGCEKGEQIVTTQPVTISPITPLATPTPIPGCVDCHPKKPKPSHSSVDVTNVPAGVVVVPVIPTPFETKAVVPTSAELPTSSGVKPSSNTTSVPTATAGAAGRYVSGFAAGFILILAAVI